MPMTIAPKASTQTQGCMGKAHVAAERKREKEAEKRMRDVGHDMVAGGMHTGGHVQLVGASRSHRVKLATTFSALSIWF